MKFVSTVIASPNFIVRSWLLIQQAEIDRPARPFVLKCRMSKKSERSQPVIQIHYHRTFFASGAPSYTPNPPAPQT